MKDSTNILPLIILGAGGHGKVVVAAAQSCGLNVVGVCDPALAAAGHSRWRGLPVLGGDEALDAIDPATRHLINGVGSRVGSTARQHIYDTMTRRGFFFPTIIHGTAWIDDSVELAPGVQIMAGAVIQPDCRIGENCIVNSAASVDHDCELGRGVHVAPGATLCGGVRVGDLAFIGAGATVIQRLSVGSAGIVGAGVTLTRDLADGHSAKVASLSIDGASQPRPRR